MATTATALHCPDCGAPVKTGDKQCWMCYRPLEWTGSSDQPAAAPRYRYQTNIWAVLGIAFAGVAMVPAALIAFFVTCLTGVINADGQGDIAGFAILPVSVGAALVVLVGFCVLIGALSTKVTRKVVW